MYESEQDIYVYRYFLFVYFFILFVSSLFPNHYTYNHVLSLSFILLSQIVGISIEFCSHITRWFISCSKKTKLDRAKSALVNMGSLVSNPLMFRCTCGYSTCTCTYTHMYSTWCTTTLEYNANTSSHQFYMNACYAWNLFAKTKFQMCY